MATKEEIQQLLDAIKGALSSKFDENDKMFTTLINDFVTLYLQSFPLENGVYLKKQKFPVVTPLTFVSLERRVSRPWT